MVSRLIKRSNGAGIRAFISIEIPHPIREQIALAAEPLKGVKGKMSWCSPNNMHITLKFLGECTRGRLGSISKNLAAIGARHAPFKLTFGGVGVFPGPASPRIIWLGVSDGADHLASLAKDVRASMESIGFKPESRPFRPHITLCRVKYLKSTQELGATIKNLPEAKIEPINADHIFLMRSQLRPKGAIYTVIERICFSGQDKSSEDNSPVDAPSENATQEILT
ncbi:RNA 2',3'-cyclic phosphodiesterase [bacterium]|nr:RNA 2',3'-cyclic phosphodiesterase [bacterium]